VSFVLEIIACVWLSLVFVVILGLGADLLAQVIPQSFKW